MTHRTPWLLILLSAIGLLAVASAWAARSPVDQAEAKLIPCIAPEESPAQGRFLVARRSLTDPNFAKTVILLLRYDESGAVGVVVNRPTQHSLSERFADVEALSERSDALYSGGPVSRSDLVVLVRSEQPVEGSYSVFQDVHFGGGEELVEDLATDPSSETSFRVFAGYAGWEPGQLDYEIDRGGWYVLPADADTIFTDDPAALWPSLISAVDTVPADLRTGNDEPHPGAAAPSEAAPSRS